MAESAAKVVAALVALTFLAAPPASASALLEEHCAGDLTCAAGAPRTGSALLQTAQEKDTVKTARATAAQDKSDGMALKGRLDALEKEVSSLQERVSALEADVGVSGGGVGGGGAAPVAAPPAEAGEAEALLGRRVRRSAKDTDEEAGETSARKQGFSVPLGSELASDEEDDSDGGSTSEGSADESEASLLQKSSEAANTEEESIKARVMTVEGAMAELRSQVSTLENHVMGSTFNTKEASFLQLQKDQDSGIGSESSLKARIVELDYEGVTLRTRVSTLEHFVTG
jgi:polyhydroxyalkanoate synthesis regulator phasin